MSADTREIEWKNAVYRMLYQKESLDQVSHSTGLDMLELRMRFKEAAEVMIKDGRLIAEDITENGLR